LASEAAAAEELSFVGEASIAAKSPVAEDALVEEEPLGADATGAAATAAKAVAPKDVAPKDVEPQGIEFNQKESTICAFDACEIHSLAATVAIQRTVPLVAGVVGAADGIAADVVADIADAANASDAAFTIDTEHEKDKNSTRSVELKLENDKPIPNIPNLDSDTDHNCCIRTNFQSKTVQLTQINGVKSR